VAYDVSTQSTVAIKPSMLEVLEKLYPSKHDNQN
jgi:hypothetical protein